MALNKVFDLRFKHNASMILGGPTMSGKTSFIRKLLSHKDFLFDAPLKRVYWFYGVFQPDLHQSLRNEGVIVREGLPSNFDEVEPYSIVILDDLMTEVEQTKGDSVTNLFTRVAHHKHCFVIMTTQNIFEKKGGRTRHVNAQYLVMFKNPRDSLQIRILGSQMYPGKKNFLTSVFADATAKPHGYLLLDSHQTTPDEIRLRTRIFPDEAPMIAYLTKL